MLVETDGSGNRQIAHYGGDNGTTSKYRKGTLHFYQNTLVSYRTDRTTLFRLSTNEERADVRNNVFYVTAAGSTLSLVDATGILDLTHNWFKPGRVADLRHARRHDQRRRHVGRQRARPAFATSRRRTFGWRMTSINVNAGTTLAPASAAGPRRTVQQYVKHQGIEPRSNDGVADLGAYEMEDGQPADLVITTGSLPSATAGTAYNATLAASGGVSPYTGPPKSAERAGGESVVGRHHRYAAAVGQLQRGDARDRRPGARRHGHAHAVADRSRRRPFPNPLVVTTASLPSARRNKNYSQTVTATGGTTPYAWSVVAGALPPGLIAQRGTGVISGRATTLGTFASQCRCATASRRRRRRQRLCRSRSRE